MRQLLYASMSRRKKQKRVDFFFPTPQFGVVEVFLVYYVSSTCLLYYGDAAQTTYMRRRDVP